MIPDQAKMPSRGTTPEFPNGEVSPVELEMDFRAAKSKLMTPRIDVGGVSIDKKI